MEPIQGISAVFGKLKDYSLVKGCGFQSREEVSRDGEVKHE